jgi:lipopolysaccharide export system protein LptA
LLKKYALYLFVLPISVFASEEVRIEANIFEVNEKEKISIFSGDVKIKKGRDELNSSVLKIYFDTENQPERYEILNNVSFKIHVKETSTYLGKAEKVNLFPKTDKYIFSKNVKIYEIESGRKIEGDKVSLDGESGSARIVGGNRKPVIMSFQVGEKEEK